MKRATLATVGLGALALLGWSSAFEVGERESVIVARLGDPSRVVDQPGLAFKLPAPIDTLIRVDRRIRVLQPQPLEYLTSDKSNVLVGCFVAWSVETPIRFVRRARDRAAAEARLGDIARAELGNLLGAHPFRALVSTEAEPVRMANLNATLTEAIAQRARDDFGIRVHMARINSLNYPRQNKQAVFQRMEAERQKIAQEIRAEGTAQAERLRADAEREAAMVINEATQRAETLRGEGEAEATRIYGEAYARDPEFYEFLRTLEAYRKIFGANSTLVIPDDAALLRLLKQGPPATTAPAAEETGRGPAGGPGHGGQGER